MIMKDQHRSVRPQRNQRDHPRSIDQFYEESSSNDISFGAVPYWIIFLALGIANSGDAAEITNMNFVLSNEGFEENILQGDFAKRGSILAACIFAGMLVGGLLAGSIGDQFGRRPTLLLGLSLNSMAGLMCAIAPGFLSLCLLRFIAGLGVGAILSSLATLATESSPPSRRGRNVAFVGSFFTFGTVYVAFLALFLFGHNDVSWRIFVALCALPCFFGNIMVYIFVPESARYLALQNRPEEAAMAANKIANAMGFQGPMLEVDELKYHHNNDNNVRDANGIAMNRKNYKLIMKENTRKAIKRIVNLYSPEMRHKTINLQMIWVTLSFGAGLSTWINVVLKQIRVDNLYMDSLYYSLSSIPGNILAAVLIDRMGRKLLMATAMMFASISLLFFSRVALQNTPEDANWAITCACSFHVFVVIAWTTVNVITSESFPTEVRSTGLGYCAASSRLMGMFVQYFYGSLMDRPDILLFISSFAMLLGACFSFSLPEMSKRHLKDTVAFVSVNQFDNNPQSKGTKVELV